MRIEKVVVGMDFSAPAVAGARWLAKHVAPAAELVLVHAIDVPTPPPFVRDALPPAADIETAARDFAETRLRELASSLPAATVRIEIRVGRPHDVLAAVAEEVGADLVLVGPHGERPRPWKLLGTSAERLVRTSPVPVLVAIDARDAAPRRLLAPVDDADITLHVLDWARRVAESFDGEVTVLHVLDGGEHSHVSVMAQLLTRDYGSASKRVEDAAREAGVRWLETLTATGLGRDRVNAAVTFGKAGDAILAMAQDMESDLIVIGRRGSGQVMPAMLGSTVGTVLHGSACPVLVVTEPRDSIVDEKESS